ncbi:hypothetical protein LshimejAT787_1202810 [Lyophyllum shimeji]|uniref:Uncharacterized protein n=1 Tax=Lyophyllum shimeji TaxID=47721 RepID=A0A9P3PTZ6_LYOSH|nr:hypothetical protein LshimejAT787_1202810 [Lyophyllum shimeji]
MGLVASAAARMTRVRDMQSRALVELADGKSLQSGKINSQLSWQASGKLWKGCTDSAIAITDCYSVSLSSDPEANLDPSPGELRQRIEFLTPGAADGTKHSFEWKYYLPSSVGTSNHFFHLMQLLTRGGGRAGPVISLDASNGKIVIRDYKRDCASTKCPSIPLSSFTDRTTLHSVTVTYGPNGHFDYVIKDAKDQGKQLLRYTVTGQMGSESSSIKFGTYRATFEGMTPVRAAMGDFKVQS